MNVPVELYALCAGFFYASSSVLVKIGLIKDSKSNATSATLLTMLTNLAFMWTAFLLTSPPTLVMEALLVFCLSGVAAQCIARTASYMGIERLGVSVSTPISSTTPLFSTIIAAVILSEALSPQTAIGTTLIVTGIITINLRRGTHNQETQWSKWDILFPIGAAVFHGLADNMRKIGLNIFNSPISGATIGITAAMAVYLPYLTLSGRMRKVSVNRRSIWFLLAGLCTGTAWILYFTGLALGKVTTMAPINNGSNPLIALLLTSILLRGKEKITLRTAVGATAIVSGVVVVSLFK